MYFIFIKVFIIHLDTDLFIHALTFSFIEVKLIFEGVLWHNLLPRILVSLEIYCAFMNVVIYEIHVYSQLFSIKKYNLMDKRYYL